MKTVGWFGFGRASGVGHSRRAVQRPSGEVRAEEGFTLVELLIVVMILPLVVGGLSVGLIAVFSLQSGVSNRLSHTADAQVVTANFQRDVQGAAQITTAPASTPQCGAGSGTQLLGLQYALDTNQDSTAGQYQYSVSYQTVAVTNNGVTTNSLVRYYCDSYSTHLVNTQVLAYDVTSSQSPPTLSCAQGQTAVCQAAPNQWVTTKSVVQVALSVSDPSGNFPYQLNASPLAASSTSTAGSPISVNTTLSCGFASPGSGTYAPNLCFIDFSALTGAALLQAESGSCVEMSVALPHSNGDSLYFCVSLPPKAQEVLPWYLPTYPDAFLGNTNGSGTAFYTGIPGSPALYQRVSGTQSTITLSNITVVTAAGIPATGWQFVSADAESTDPGEWISWSSDVAISAIPNNPLVPSPPFGTTACQGGVGHVDSSGNPTASTIYNCFGLNSGTKSGTAMVTTLTPTQMTVTMKGAGLEAVAFGVLLP